MQLQLVLFKDVFEDVFELFNAPMHPLKHVQFVNNILMYIVLL